MWNVCANCKKRQRIVEHSAENKKEAIINGFNRLVKCKNCGIVIGEYLADGRLVLWYKYDEENKF